MSEPLLMYDYKPFLSQNSPISLPFVSSALSSAHFLTTVTTDHQMSQTPFMTAWYLYYKLIYLD